MHALADSQCNCFALRAASRHVTAFYDGVLAPLGLRTTQFGILSRLLREGPRSINALAADLVMDRTTLGRNIRPLERDGLLEVTADLSDRRSRAVSVTAKGEAAVREGRALWASAQGRFEAKFGIERSAALRATLRDVARIVF